jgi:Flp pilus assembly pilin Flp
MIKNIRKLIRRGARDERAIAAVEFAMIAPVMVILIAGIIELTFRYQVDDKFTRFVSQAGDFFSRNTTLTTDDIETFHAQAETMMRPAPVSFEEELQMTVTSICFDPDGNPEIVWQRAMGGPPENVDPQEAEGLGENGETVIRVDAQYTYKSPIGGMFSTDALIMKRRMFYKPRETRAIAIDGKISEVDNACYATI